MMRIVSTSVDDRTSARTIPSSTISNAMVIAAAVVAIMCGLTDSTRADIPQINIEETCRAAARAMVSLMGGSTTEQDRKACLDSEQKAREQIIKDQATYSSADKRRCMRTRDYLPSYVEWLTCLEMERDVRKKRQGKPPATDTKTLPRVRPGRQARGTEQEQEVITQRPVRRRVTARGSGGSYAPARLSTPSLGLPQPSTGVYIPPPISNPSGQINQLNHSFPLNGGLGNNPTGRDAYIRYNLTR
jgi:hypothetical protein